MTGKLAVRRGLQALAVYATLWLLTATLGRHQVREPILTAVRDTVMKARTNLPAIELRTDAFDRQRLTYKQYYVTASAPVPFLVHVKRGYLIEPMWGAGADEWYVWAFGARFRVYQPMLWLS
jgi:hypothetical protein